MAEASGGVVGDAQTFLGRPLTRSNGDGVTGGACPGMEQAQQANGNGGGPVSPRKKQRMSAGGGPISKVTVVLGAQWGDEGKGKVVDMLAMDADVVCRCQVRFLHNGILASSSSYTFLRSAFAPFSRRSSNENIVGGRSGGPP